MIGCMTVGTNDGSKGLASYSALFDMGRVNLLSKADHMVSLEILRGARPEHRIAA